MTISAPTTAGQILTSAYVNNNINPGLDYITEASTATTLLSFNNVFSATYLNYRIVGNITSSTFNGNVGFRYRVAGSDSALSSYTWVVNNLSSSGGTPATAVTGGQAQTTAFFAYATATSGHATGFVIDIYNPFGSTHKSATSQSTNASGSIDIYQGGFAYAQTASYTGFTIIGSNNFACSAKVYGYRQA